MHTGRLRPPHVNLVLRLLLLALIGTGLTSWAVDDPWNGWIARAHGVIGFSLLLLVPAKLRGPVRAGFRRGRWTRWISAAFGILVLATIALGVLHATGLWYGVGYWSALWTHELFGFAVIGLLVWHQATRPVRARMTDLDRRAALRTGLLVGAALSLYVTQEAVTRVTGLPGGRRRGTGSHEVGSHRPEPMPEVIWLDDHRPAVTDEGTWPLVVARRANDYRVVARSGEARHGRPGLHRRLVERAGLGRGAPVGATATRRGSQRAGPVGDRIRAAVRPGRPGPGLPRRRLRRSAAQVGTRRTRAAHRPRATWAVVGQVGDQCRARREPVLAGSLPSRSPDRHDPF